MADRVAASFAEFEAKAKAIHQEVIDAEANAAHWRTELERIQSERESAEAAWSRGDIDVAPPTDTDTKRIETAVRGANRRLANAQRAKLPPTDQRVAELLAPIVKQHERIPVYVTPNVPDDLTPSDLAEPIMFVSQQSNTLDLGDGALALSTYKTPSTRTAGEPLKIVLIRDELYAPLDGHALRNRLNAARVTIKEATFGRVSSSDPIDVATYPSLRVPGLVEDVAEVEVISAHPAAPAVPNLSNDARADQVRDWVCGGLAREVKFNWSPGTGAVERTATTSTQGTTTDTYAIRLAMLPPEGTADVQASWKVEDMVRDDVGALVPNVGTVSAASVESVRREVVEGSTASLWPISYLVARVVYSVTRAS